MANDTQQNDTQPKQALAQERTDWALERTLLATERTFGAWIRTGIAALVVGLAAARLLTIGEPRWLIQTLGTIFISTSVVIFLLAFRGYRSTARKLAAEGATGAPPLVIALVTGVLCLAAAVGLILLFQT